MSHHIFGALFNVPTLIYLFSKGSLKMIYWWEKALLIWTVCHKKPTAVIKLVLKYGKIHISPYSSLTTLIFPHAPHTICISTQRQIFPACCAAAGFASFSVLVVSLNRVWHSHGIWCLCDCIKQVCGLRQRWTGRNPAAALHWTAPSLPPTTAHLGKCLRCSLKTCHPTYMLQVVFSSMSREV